MTVRNFVRDSAYFQGLRDQDLVINGEDYDIQFNQIARYINGQVKPIADGFVGDAIPGIALEEKSNQFLKNVGDGTTDFTVLSNSAIDNFTLSLSKLIKGTPGSILGADDNRVFNGVTPISNNQALISDLNNAASWKKVTGRNFTIHTLQGSKLDYAMVSRDLLSNDVVGRPVADNVIFENFILDQNISGTKLTDSSLPFSKFSASVQTKINQALAQNKTIDPFSKIGGYTSQGRPNGFTDIEMDEIRPKYGYQNRHFANSSIPGDQLIGQLDATAIAPNTITVNDFGPNRNRFNRLIFSPGAINRFKIQAGTIDFRNSKQRFNNLGPKFTKEKLSPAIRQKLGI